MDSIGAFDRASAGEEPIFAAADAGSEVGVAFTTEDTSCEAFDDEFEAALVWSFNAAWAFDAFSIGLLASAGKAETGCGIASFVVFGDFVELHQ